MRPALFQKVVNRLVKSNLDLAWFVLIHNLNSLNAHHQKALITDQLVNPYKHKKVRSFFSRFLWSDIRKKHTEHAFGVLRIMLNFLQIRNCSLSLNRKG